MVWEIDNFYFECFIYYNVCFWDEELVQLLLYWKEMYCFIEVVRVQGIYVLVYCKMGVSCLVVIVLVYVMKQYECSLEQVLCYVQEFWFIVCFNFGFLCQLQIYQGILMVSCQSYVWEQKVGGVFLEEYLVFEVFILFLFFLLEFEGGGEEKVVGMEESQVVLKEEFGLWLCINF